MAEYLLDTNIVSYLTDKSRTEHQIVKGFITKLGSNKIAISCITTGEIQYGCELHLKHAPARVEEIKGELQKYSMVYKIDKHVADIWSVIRAGLYEKYSERNSRGQVKKIPVEDLYDFTTSKSLGIQENDLWIVAIVANHKLKFLTHDKKLNRILEIAKQKYPDIEWIDPLKNI